MGVAEDDTAAGGGGNGQTAFERDALGGVNPDVLFAYDPLQGKGSDVPENTIPGVLRPTGVLTCYRTRRRIGAWLDRALPDGEARAVATHLAGCAGCRGEAQTLRRTRELVRAAAAVAEPDWTGFWAGIVRGIEAGSAAPARARDLLVPRRRFALVGAVAALLAVTIWSGDSLTTLQYVNSVALADTEYPQGSVMVYTPPENDMTVIWVFGSDNHSSGNEI